MRADPPGSPIAPAGQISPGIKDKTGTSFELHAASPADAGNRPGSDTVGPTIRTEIEPESTCQQFYFLWVGLCSKAEQGIMISELLEK